MLLSRVELSRKYCSRNGQGNPCCGLLHRSCVPSHSCYCGARLGLPGMLSSLHKGKSEAYKDFAEGCEVLMGLDLSGRRETTEEVNHQSWNSLRKPSSLVPSTRQMCLVVTAMTWCSLDWNVNCKVDFTSNLPCHYRFVIWTFGSTWAQCLDPACSPPAWSVGCAAATISAPALPPALVPVLASLREREPAPGSAWQRPSLWSKCENTEIF